VIVSRAELLSLVPPFVDAAFALLPASFVALLAFSFAARARELPLLPRAVLLLPESDLALAPERAWLDPLDPSEDLRPRDEERLEDPR
jgi:surfactin synthase thioesterase subunit